MLKLGNTIVEAGSSTFINALPLIIIIPQHQKEKTLKFGSDVGFYNNLTIPSVSLINIFSSDLGKRLMVELLKFFKFSTKY